MKKRDSLHRFIIENTDVRGKIVHLDASWQAVLARHGYPEPIRDLLGEAMAASVLLGATIKFNGSLTLQIQGDGPVSLLVVQVSTEGTLRGLAEWSGEIKPAPLKDLFQNGRLAITIDQGEELDNYQGIVDLGDGDLATALEGYFTTSEQLDTRIWLVADEQQAAGFMLQQMPASESSIDDYQAEDEDAWQRIVYLGSTITRKELLELDTEELIHRLFHEEDVRLFAAEQFSFSCTCSRERIEETLRGLGYGEVHDILKETEIVEVNCHFCNQRYEFDAVDVEQIFAAGFMPEVPTTRH